MIYATDLRVISVIRGEIGMLKKKSPAFRRGFLQVVMKLFCFISLCKAQ